MITNLLDECCVEGPIFADKTGLKRVIVGELPPQCAALNLTNINVQRLAVHAAKTGDFESVVHACALDPLTGAVLTLKEIRDMAADMIEAEIQCLPQFAGKTIKRTTTIIIPDNVKRMNVPADPELAVLQRFGELSR